MKLCTESARNEKERIIKYRMCTVKIKSKLRVTVLSITSRQCKKLRLICRSMKLEGGTTTRLPVSNTVWDYGKRE